MSSTRTAKLGTPLKQNRWASSPEIERGLLANLVAARCSVLEAPEDRELIWFIQLLSHRDGGLPALAADLLRMYPDRIGTALMRRLSKQAKQSFSADQVRALRAELPARAQESFLLKGEAWDPLHESPEIASEDDCADTYYEGRSAEHPSARPLSYKAEDFLAVCRQASANLEDDLKKLCLDPSVPMQATWPWWFAELVPCLREYQIDWIESRRAGTVTTELGRMVKETLDYALKTGCLVLIEGLARMGKTFSAKAWCDQHPGHARYCQVPSTNDEIGFFRAIAKALGISSGLSWKAVQLRERCEDVLQRGNLMLLLDEAHFCLPTNDYRYALPGRITWIMTALVNHGVPVALVTTPQFIKTQKLVEARTNWTSDQFIGRIGHYQKLPDSLSENDLKQVAKALLPEGDAKSIEILVRYAQGSAKYLAGIESAVRRARYLANRENRQQATRADIKRAIQESVIPSDTALSYALAEPERRRRPRASGSAFNVPLKPIFEPPALPLRPPATTDFLERASAPDSTNRLSEPSCIERNAVRV